MRISSIVAMTTPPAGWYPQQTDPSALRYWDGTGWTDRVRPVSGGPDEPTQPLAVAPPTPVHTPHEHRAAPSVRPWYQHGWAKVVGGVMVFFVGMAILGSFMGNPDTSKAATASGQEEGEAPSLAAEESPAPAAADDESEQAAPKPESKTGTPKKKKEKSQVGGTAGTGGLTFVMPNEVGKTLQAAQDDIQAVSGDPIFFSFSEDATGADRMQLLDSGWQVCRQTPAVGATVKLTADVTFYVVRVSEDCP